MKYNYEVPIIPQNLRKDETIVQVADALKHVEKVAEDIFNRVNTRIEQNRTNLQRLQARIELTKEKINQLSGARKTTLVLSSSKYPASDNFRRYRSIFDDDTKLPFTRSKVNYKDLEMKDEPLENLQFYHVKINVTDEVSTINGLGDVPSDVQSINDLLLCNSNKNPYEKYILSDPLQSSVRLKKDEALDSSNIGAAPHSISDRTTIVRSATESYFYSPDLGNVPSIDVPLDLPDLPGIADDLRYVDEEGPGIAPSVTTTPSIPDLPALVFKEDETNVEEPPQPLPTPELEVKLPTPPPEEKSIVTPTAEIPKIQEISIAIDIASSKIAAVKPPPGPADILTAHATLMEAIRQAGGSKNAKLRSAESKKAPPSGDLMADLHAKLSLRRKGISGAKPQENQLNFDSGSTLTKISAMIPPPPTETEADSTNTEDEGWDE